MTSLRIPALREHVEDIPALVDHFSRAVTERYGLPRKTYAREAVAAFARRPWPGNLRELRNVVEEGLLLAEDDVVPLTALPAGIAELGEEPRPAGEQALASIERSAIDAAIRTYHGNLARTARSLLIAKSTLYVYLRARSDGAWGRQRPEQHEPKPPGFQAAEDQCMG